MAKSNRSDSQKSGQTHTNTGKQQAQPANKPSNAAASERKSKQEGKSRKSTIGGTAVHGARSTQPKEVPTGAQASQQAEYYNREMRRRMQQMGTGPYNERATTSARDLRQKRKERIQERREKLRQTIVRKGPSRDIRLGRRNTFFVIGVIAAVVVLIVVFLIIRHV